MKTSKAVALTFAFALAGPLAAHAQATGETTPVHHHYQVHHFQNGVHHVHHRFQQPAAAAPVVVAPTPAAQALPFGLALPHIAPYPDGKGDEDGLSEGVDDCNKGCIDGNTPD
jgi:hypothetical protein